MSTYSSAKLRVIPFYHYIRLMMMCGLVRDEMKSILLSMNFNTLPEEVWDRIEDGIRSDPAVDILIRQNRRKRTMREHTLIPDRFLETFKAKDMAIMLMHSFDIKRHRNRRSHTKRAKHILDKWEEREYIECAASQGIPLSIIKERWNSYHGEAYNKLSLRALAAFYYFFWDVSEKTLDSLGATKQDLLDYLVLNKRSPWYSNHRYLLYRQPIELFHYFGLMTNEERVGVNRLLLGDAVKEIRAAQRTSKPVPPEAVDLFKTVNSELVAIDKEKKSVDSYRDEMDRIFSRVKVVKRERESIDEIRKKTYEFSTSPELDTPYNPDED